MSVGWFSLDAAVKGLVIHGTEPKDTEPLLSVEQAKVGLRIDSFWGRRVSLKRIDRAMRRKCILRVEKERNEQSSDAKEHNKIDRDRCKKRY